MTETERLIRAVRENPVIYDPSHCNHKILRRREEAWYKIAEIFQNYDIDWKKKWKNLKDSYVKYLKAESIEHWKLNTVTKRYKCWPWASNMEFLRPFCKITSASSSNTTTEKNWMDLPDDVYSDDSFEGFTQEIFNEHDPCEEKPKDTKPESAKELAEPEIQHIDVDRLSKSEVKTSMPTPKQRRSENYSNFNDIELILMGYAKTIKTFSTRRQAMVKFKFSKILMEEELAQLAEDENNDGPSAKKKWKHDFSHSSNDSLK